MAYPITIKEKIEDNSNGRCTKQDRNFSGKIILSQDSPNLRKTLIHELIHKGLFKKEAEGYRLAQKLNNDEDFIDFLATEIYEGLKEFGEWE